MYMGLSSCHILFGKPDMKENSIRICSFNLMAQFLIRTRVEFITITIIIFLFYWASACPSSHISKINAHLWVSNHFIMAAPRCLYLGTSHRNSNFVLHLAVDPIPILLQLHIASLCYGVSVQFFGRHQAL